MKKKIKDLTLGEAKKICNMQERSNKFCEGCPLRKPYAKIRKCPIYYDEVLEMEVEVDEINFDKH
jgi:hypothetical protein